MWKNRLRSIRWSRGLLYCLVTVGLVVYSVGIRVYYSLTGQSVAEPVLGIEQLNLQEVRGYYTPVVPSHFANLDGKRVYLEGIVLSREWSNSGRSAASQPSWLQNVQFKLVQDALPNRWTANAGVWCRLTGPSVERLQEAISSREQCFTTVYGTLHIVHSPDPLLRKSWCVYTMDVDAIVADGIGQGRHERLGLVVWSDLAAGLMLLGLIFAVTRDARFRRTPAKTDGAVPCEACGYDIRHSFDRCPECGHPCRLSRGAT